MTPIDSDAWSDADRADLRRAKALLEHPGLAVQLANFAGAPIEYLYAKQLPGKARKLVDKATHKAITAACRVALATIKHDAPMQAPHNTLHKLGVAATGAVGGFFGLASLPVELPVTTTVMLRSILDIARAEGASLDDPATRIDCLQVLALGGPRNDDDAAETGYFAVRAALAQQVSAAISHVASHGAADRGAPVIVNLVGRIAAYFAIPVSEKALADALPVIGAATGSSLNVLFMHHFQHMAEGHFIVRRLEKSHGAEAVRKAYAII
ncbi:MAG TPA: EcsC family protein [Rhodanobacteraceae bacterium]